MKQIFLVFYMLTALCIHAKQDTLLADTKITDVTVFFNGAEITRAQNLKLKPGKLILQINDLPQELFKQSIQVKGLEKAEILSVKHQINFDDMLRKSAEEKAIDQQLKAIDLNVEALKNEHAVFVLEEKFLLENSSMKKSGTSNDLENLKNTATYYRTRTLQIHQNKARINSELNKLKKEIEKLYKELNRITVKRRQAKSQVFIAIESKVQISEAIELSYYVPSAGWEPTYDFRVDDISKPLKIVYSSNVYQSTGEDWKQVNIRLSSNNPSLDGNSPELQPWVLGQYISQTKSSSRQDLANSSVKGKVSDEINGEPIPFANVILKKDNKVVLGTTTDFEGLFTLKPIPSGYYDLEVSYLGYSSKKITRVHCIANKITEVRVILSTGIRLDEVVISGFKKPLFEKDQTSIGQTVTREELQSMAARSPSNLARTAGSGVFSRDDGNGALNSRGSRSSNQISFIDGVMSKRFATEETNLISNSIKNKVANLEYQIETPYTILSDGEDYTLKIKEVNLPVDYVYHAFPKFESDVFLNAKITDWGSLNLLSGKSYIYYQGTFTNESFLDVDRASDTLNISLGRDKSIFILREGNKELYDKNSFGNNIKETLVWDISVRNNKASEVKIIVHDQYPISPRKSIEVELNNDSKAIVDKKKAMLNWELLLKPDEKKTIQFGYTVKYPKYSGLSID